jgi:hypothetical protein
MLKACGLPTPKSILAHGWWSINGAKMSKSTGNFVEPLAFAEQYGVDALRFFMIREMSVGQDSDFSLNQFLARYNSELANNLGNLVNRTLNMTNRFGGGVVPAADAAAGVADPGHRQHLGGKVEAIDGHISALAKVEPVLEGQGANPHRAADVEGAAHRGCEAGLDRREDGVPKPPLGLVGLQGFLGPHPQGHGIGGLLRLTGRLPAEVALLIGVEPGR